MEYNLQKTLIDSTDFDSYNGDEYSVDIFDSITPGIGQIVPDDNFIVPLYHNSDLTTIMKEDNLDTIQIGGGGPDVELTEKDSEIENHTDETPSTSKSNLETPLLATQERKRKQMDPEIYDSFMHPKIFKTNTLTFESKSSEFFFLKTRRQRQKKQFGGKVSKHKFNIY